MNGPTAAQAALLPSLGAAQAALLPSLSAPQAALVHGLFEWAGIALGVALFRRARRRAGLPAMSAPGGFALMAGLLLGAALGNKLVFLVEQPAAWWDFWQHGAPLRLGQSIVGGLLGGLLGIEAAKALSGQRASTGDAMVLPLAAGIALGRVGCLLAGLHDDTWGGPTTLPWGLDPGDGVPRHPAPLYEMAVLAALAGLLHRHRAALARESGLAFKLFLAAYLAWRWAIDGLKPVPHAYALGWSGIQWTCALALAAYLPLLARATLRWGRAAPAAAPRPARSTEARR